MYNMKGIFIIDRRIGVMNRISRINKLLAIMVLCLGLCLNLYGCGDNKENGTPKPATQTEAAINTESPEEANETPEPADNEKYRDYAAMTADEIVAKLNIPQKVSQMLLPAYYAADTSYMKDNCLGGVIPQEPRGASEWRDYVDEYVRASIESEAGIPAMLGQDDVHGADYCEGAVIYPHNIGLGATADEDLVYRIGLATAEEAKLCHLRWNYSPCLARSVDPRWGRTYESYGADIDMIKKLSLSYSKGLMDGGTLPCAKHFFGDGDVVFGTGEKSDVDRLIDRGDAVLSDKEIDKHLALYKAQIDAGVKTIMISHSSLNGVKMHENEKYIRMIKEDMGFEGFIVSDWNSIQHTSGKDYYSQIVTAVNCGIDMLMEADTPGDVADILIRAVEDGDITTERLDDAARRIIQVKLDLGLFDDPYYEKLQTKVEDVGSDEYRALAREAVKKSLVLVKNNGILPLKKGMKLYITGPAADNKVAQCGGWTNGWNESPIEDMEGVTTLLGGFEEIADEYGAEIITDEDDAASADAVILAVGEKSYAEWNGDAKSIDLCGKLGLEGNKEAIKEAKRLNKPVVACVIAGRQVFIKKYIDDFDALIMCYLPGSEGGGIADMCFGTDDFTGRLPSPWYDSVKGIESKKPWLKKGFGLK